MKNEKLTEQLLQNPENEVKVLVSGKWYLLEDIRKYCNNPEVKKNDRV